MDDSIDSSEAKKFRLRKKVQWGAPKEISPPKAQEHYPTQKKSTYTAPKKESKQEKKRIKDPTKQFVTFVWDKETYEKMAQLAYAAGETPNTFIFDFLCKNLLKTS